MEEEHQSYQLQYEALLRTIDVLLILAQYSGPVHQGGSSLVKILILCDGSDIFVASITIEQPDGALF